MKFHLQLLEASTVINFKHPLWSSDIFSLTTKKQRICKTLDCYEHFRGRNNGLAKFYQVINNEYLKETKYVCFFDIHYFR